MNQYSPFGFVLDRLFLAPGPKIFLQQYRPLDGVIGRRLVDSWKIFGCCASG